MAENGYGPGPVAGHSARIPNYGKTHVNPMGNVEPPACIQNAMMTKDKKPFTYTPGGLDLSQIRTPSMARRLARQRSQEEHEQAAYNAQQPPNGGAYHPQGGPVPPPPPPPQAPPAPPPPPPLIIENSKSPKPVPLGERPEIVIPENPIGMLRKTNSPYHWEAEKAEMQRIGPVPKFVEKVPSPLTVKMPPSSFSQQPPQSYNPQPNNMTRPNSAYKSNYNQTPDSPVHKPEPMYAHQQSGSPNTSTPTRHYLQRQDSQFNKSPMPFGGQSPITNSSAPFSPSPNSSWRQPERRDSPAKVMTPPSSQHNRSQFSPNVQQYPQNNQPQPQSQHNRSQFSPNVQQYPQNNQPQPQSQPGNIPSNFYTLPRTGARAQDNNVGNQRDNNNNNTIYNNTNRSQSPTNAAPWRSNTLNRPVRDTDNYPPSQNININQPWKQTPEVNNAQREAYQPWSNSQNETQQHIPPWVSQETNNNRAQDNYSPSWRNNQDMNNNKSASMSSPSMVSQDQPRYQSHMSIPVTPRKTKPEPEFNQSTPPQKEAVYVTQEPVYFCLDSPNSMPPWVKTQKEKTKTPPPIWCQKPLEGRKSAPRELVTPPRDNSTEPEWIRKSNEMQRNLREVVSPPKYQQPVQPNWSTRPSENRKSLPRENGPMSPGGKMIPVQIEDQNRHVGNQPPQLRIVIDMQDPNAPSHNPRAQVPFSQPTQRIMRVLSPQLVRMDDGPSQTELPTLNRAFNANNNNMQQNQPKTRIIPIQLEGGGTEGPNKRVYYHRFTHEGPPRQSKAFKVLQVITGTEDSDSEVNEQKPINSKEMKNFEQQHGYTDL